jgi:hypothetical protein
MSPTEYKRLNLWRRENPPSAEQKCWFVQGAWLKGRDVARVLVDPLSGKPAFTTLMSAPFNGARSDPDRIEQDSSLP